MRRLRSAAGKPATETRVSVPAPKVATVALESRPVFTVWPEDFREVVVGADFAECKGAIVRVLPPEGATDDGIATVERKLRGSGAIVVRVMPVPRTATVTADAKAEAATAPAATRTIREVVAALVERASTKNRAELEAVIEEALAAEGL